MQRRIRQQDVETLLKIGIVALCSALAAGCAGTLAYRDGKDLVSQGNVEQGLAKYREAMSQDPGNLGYKKEFLQTKEQATYGYLIAAEQAASSGNLAGAAQFYQRVLAIDPSNDRSKASMETLERTKHHGELLEEGRTALAANDLATANARLASVMAEDRRNPAALALQKEIANKVNPTPHENTLAAIYRQPISIDFRDAPLRQIFEVIARTAGINFVFDKDVKNDQRTSIFLKNSSVEAALRFLLLTNQLEQQVLDGNTVMIYPSTSAKEKDYQEMVVKSFYMGSADAKTVANSIKAILKLRDVFVDDKLNMIVVRDSPSALRLAERLIAMHDVPEPEVMLELEVLEVKRTRLLELGVEWPTTLSLTPLAASTGGTLTLRDLRSNLNSSTLGASIGSTNIRARKEDGDTNLLANPRIRASNHEKAKVLIGERLPNITSTATSTGFVSESISYVDVGLKLDIEPTIYLDNEIAIKVALEVSSVTNQVATHSGTIAYQIGTRTASTALRLKDGENQILAGLINDEDRRTGNKVPLLGDLPIIGRLFGRGLNDNQKTEIVLSVTPHLIRNIRRPDAALSEFSSGTESNLRTRYDTSILVSSATLAGVSPNAAATASGKMPTSPTTNSAGVPANAGTNGSAANAGNDGTGVIAGGALPAAPNGGVQMQWLGPASVKLGDTFSIQLMGQSDQPVATLPITMGFDSKVLELVGASEGIFLKQGGAQTSFSSQVNQPGQLVINNTRVGSGGASLSAPVAILNFRSIAASPGTPLQIVSVAPTAPGGQTVGARSVQPLVIAVLP